MPSLEFFGATGTVTGSKFLVSSGASRVLVDCGLYQGARELRERNWHDLPLRANELDAIVITHAHIDHCGYLPRLVAQGFDGPVYATPSTIELARIVLPDSGHLNEEEAEYANRKGFSRHRPAKPLYTEDEAVHAGKQFRELDYAATVEIAPDVRVRLSRAGHILGAASVDLQLGAGGPTVVVSGDLGRPNHPLLAPPDAPPSADYILVESTYGDRLHLGEPFDVLADTISTTIDRGGNVVIPAFAVDRTEVLLQHLTTLATAHRLPADLPIFVDSPMALDALTVYRQAIGRGDLDIRPELRGRANPFDLSGLREVRDVEGSKALNNPDQPCVIISAAGMASGGRVVHHLAHALPDKRNTVLLVGFQAAGTRGRQLLDGATELKMMGKYVRVRAQIVDLPIFSVHADAIELVDWLARSGRPPEAVFVVHGEPAASAALATRIRSTLDWTAVVPHLMERVQLDR